MDGSGVARESQVCATAASQHKVIVTYRMNE